MIDSAFWRGKRVFVTGHTGFKGGWLAAWLVDLGANVTGYALDPDTDPSFYKLCGLGEHLHSIAGDVRDARHIRAVIEAARPEIVFHLAAQPLVRRSYREPVQTFETNVMGTVHLLDAARHCSSIRAVLIITSDKCYENREWPWAYRENDPLGGKDPYSASKACAELATAAFRDSFFRGGDRSIGIATARAGNVIGGGDWSEDRLVPDAVRALTRGESLVVRYPQSIRPWQHVLEPLAGYLLLAGKLYEGGGEWSSSWNFGPPDREAVSVAELADLIVRCWGGAWREAPSANSPHEARGLRLDSSKARQQLGWRPRLTLEQAVQTAMEWYCKAAEATSAQEVFALTRDQIARYRGSLVFDRRTE